MNASVDPSPAPTTFADGVRRPGKGDPTPLAPLLAGARARGVADGLELIGAAAALLDEQGEVLHVNARAMRLMGEALFLADQRLRARDRAADETLAAAIGSTLRYGVASRVAVGEGSGRGRSRRADRAGRGGGRRIVPVAAGRRDHRAARRSGAGAKGMN